MVQSTLIRISYFCKREQFGTSWIDTFGMSNWKIFLCSTIMSLDEQKGKSECFKSSRKFEYGIYPRKTSQKAQSTLSLPNRSSTSPVYRGEVCVLGTEHLSIEYDRYQTLQFHILIEFKNIFIKYWFALEGNNIINTQNQDETLQMFHSYT